MRDAAAEMYRLLRALTSTDAIINQGVALRLRNEARDLLCSIDQDFHAYEPEAGREDR